MAATYIPPAASESDPVATAALANAVASLTTTLNAVTARVASTETAVDGGTP